MSTVLRGVRIPDLFGSPYDSNGVFDIGIAEGVVTEVGDLGSATFDEEIDGSGYLLLPAPAEPHAHLDKALTADLVLNERGDLGGAIEAWVEYRSTLSADDIAERATRALHLGAGHGLTAVRTHVDIGSGIGLTGLEALQRVKTDVSDWVSVEIVGLVNCPLVGPAGVENRALIADAVDIGLDVVGGVPHLDDDSTAATRILFDLAANGGLPIDLHTDENLEVDSLDLELLADLVVDSGFGQSVTASHCVSLGMQPESVQRRVAEKVVAAGMSVVVLPQTNLFLQARDIRVAQPRGLTALGALVGAGVNVAGGADNLQDPFCTVGRGDPMETAALLVMAGHMTPKAAYDAVSNRARQVLGLSQVDLTPGSPADFLLIAASSVREAVAMATATRLIVRSGRLVALQPEVG